MQLKAATENKQEKAIRKWDENLAIFVYELILKDAWYIFGYGSILV